MSPRAGRRARAYGDLGAGTDGAGRQRARSIARAWSAVRPIYMLGRLGVRAPL